MANAAVRGRLQQASSSAEQRRYEALAHDRGIAVPAGAALGSALWERLAPRRRGRGPRRKGDMHIFLAYGLSNWEAILPDALSPFGRVTAFEWRGRGWNDQAPDWLARRDGMNRDLIDVFDAANRECPVDAFVGYLSGHNTSPDTLRAVAAGGAAIFNFCWDDKLAFSGPRLGGRHRSPAAIASVVDLNLTNAPASRVKYAVHDGLATFFPEAAHPALHRPHDASFEFDVSFVGARYGLRPRFMRDLERLGVRVECFGRGWPNGPLSDDEVVRLYSRSRINLGFSTVGYSRSLMVLKGRDFEVPMSGGLYLTEHNPELDLVFDVGTEIITYRDVHECARQVRRLLADPALAHQVRLAGRARSLRDHSYETRWACVFELARLLESGDSVPTTR
jgi:hypothetical protein